MKNIILGASIVLAIDAVATVAVIVAARKSPVFRRRLVDSLRLIVGDAYLRVVPAAYTVSNEDFLDDDGPDYERDGFRPEVTEEDLYEKASNNDH